MAPPENFKCSPLFKQMPVPSALGERQGGQGGAGGSRISHTFIAGVLKKEFAPLMEI